MNIVCKQCNATYRISDKKLPQKKFMVQCKKCGQRIGVDPNPSAATREAAAEFKAASVSKSSAAGPELIAAYPQLESISPAHFDLASVFGADKKGRYKHRKNTFKVKILTAVAETIRTMLEDGERVQHIAWGTAYYPLEIFFGNGWLTTLYNRYALAATDRRLLMIHTDHRLKRPGHYRFQMRYGEIRKIRRGLFRTSLILSRKKGKSRIFTALKPYLSKEIHEHIQHRADSRQPVPEGPPSYEKLCPACNTALPDKLAACSGCRAEFKTVKRAVLRSLVLPGWGDLYLGHRMLGIIELLGSLFVWMVVLQLLTAGNEGVMIGFFLLCLYNGLDALLTWSMAGKGYILEREFGRMNAAVHTAGARA